MGKTLELLLGGILSLGAFGASEARQNSSQNVHYSVSPAQEQKQNEKLPVPSDSDIKTRENDLKELYKDDYAQVSQRRVEDRIKAEVANKFLNIATASGTGDIERFVLLRDARDLSAGSKAFDITYNALVEMHEKYDVKLEDAVKEAISNVPRSGLTKDDVIANAGLHLQLAEYIVNQSDAYSADHYSAGVSFAKTASRLVSRFDRDMKKQADTLAKIIPELDKEHKAFFDASMKMSVEGNDLDDPKTNEVIGKYLCFRKGNWDEGIKFLQKSDDKTLQMLTRMELNVESNSDSQYDMGERWYSASNGYQVKRNNLEHERFQGRARHWYETALATATGTLKAKIVKRLSEIKPTSASGGAGSIDMLAMINTAKDTFEGAWSRSGQKVSTPRSTSCLKIPYMPPKEYDITMEFKTTEGIDSVIFGLVKDDVNFVAWIDNSFQSDKYSGFQMVGRNPMTSTVNKTVHKGKVIKQGRPTVAVYSVRENTASITVDGKLISKWERSQGEIGTNRILAPNDYTGPYIGVYDTGLEITKLTITPVSGGMGKRQ